MLATYPNERADETSASRSCVDVCHDCPDRRREPCRQKKKGKGGGCRVRVRPVNVYPYIYISG